VTAGAAREAQIAQALNRVKQRVGSGPATGPGAGVGTGAGQGGAGGTGPPLGPGERLGVPWGSPSAPSRGAEFLAYYNEMIERIRAAWAWTGGRPDLEVKVRFRITDQGDVIDVVLAQSSGDGTYDQSVLKALRAVRRLRPPPAAHRADFADVELTFRPGDLQSSARRPQ
jgi:TonB family protein